MDKSEVKLKLVEIFANAPPPKSKKELIDDEAISRCKYMLWSSFYDELKYAVNHHKDEFYLSHYNLLSSSISSEVVERAWDKMFPIFKQELKIAEIPYSVPLLSKIFKFKIKNLKKFSNYEKLSTLV